MNQDDLEDAANELLQDRPQRSVYTLTHDGRLTLALTAIRSDESTADAVEDLLDRNSSLLLETAVVLADRGVSIDRVLCSACQQALVAVRGQVDAMGSTGRSDPSISTNTHRTRRAQHLRALR